MKDKAIIIIDKIIFSVIIFITFSLPIFFLPYTSEAFEFPKTILIFITSIILFFLWIFKSLISGRLEILKTPLNLTLVLFFVIYIIATIFSLDRYVSLVDFHPRFYGSLYQFFSLILFFFIAASNIEKEKVKSVILVLVGSASLLALLAIFSYFNSLPQVSNFNQNFTPLSNFNNLAMLLTITLPLSFYFLLESRKIYQIIFSFIVIIKFFCLILINFLPAMIVLLAISLIFIAFIPQLSLVRKQIQLLTLLGLIFGLLSAIVYIPQLSNNLLLTLANRSENDNFLPKEPELPQLAGWSITAKTLASRPILGTGPSTYPYAFTTAKPTFLNTTPFWNLRFYKSSNEIFRVFTETGVLGGFTFLLLILTLARFVLNKIFKQKQSLQSFFITLSTIAILLSTFLFAFNLILIFILFLIAAILMVISQDNNQVYPVKLALFALPIGNFLPLSQKFLIGQKIEPLTFILMLVAVVVLVFGLFLSAQLIRAEVFYKQALVAVDKNNAKEAIGLLQQAVKTTPSRDQYHRALGSLYTIIAQNLARKQNLTEAERQNLSLLVNQAINQGRLITGYNIVPVAGTSPLNVVNWVTLANTYLSFIGIAGNSEVHAITILRQAIRLDPANVSLRENFGKVYLNIGETDEAIKAFESEIELKPDHHFAHYNLAQALKAKGGQENRVIQELSQALLLLPDDWPQKNRIEKELEVALQKLQESQKPPPPVPSDGTPVGGSTPATPSAQ